MSAGVRALILLGTLGVALGISAFDARTRELRQTRVALTAATQRAMMAENRAATAETSNAILRSDAATARAAFQLSHYYFNALRDQCLTPQRPAHGSSH